MKLLVGLGNPGREYEKSRHNVGFMVLERLHKELELPAFKIDKKLSAETSKGNYQGIPVLLAKPQTFMNLSGDAVRKTIDFYKIAPEDIIVVYDDLDLPLGTIRVRMEGGAGTHNGMKSVVGNIGTKFIRIRVGIESRPPAAKDPEQTASYVLGRFSSAEREIIDQSVQKSAEALKLLILGDSESAMNAFN